MSVLKSEKSVRISDRNIRKSNQQKRISCTFIIKRTSLSLYDSERPLLSEKAHWLSTYICYDLVDTFSL